MPRLSPNLIRKASSHSKLLPLLLSACRTLDSAKQELHWIKTELPQARWLEACLQRSKLVPLQHILGSQPFGSIDVGCKRNVLIPRWETEEWCLELIDCLKNGKFNGAEKLKILDVCTGTGCIPILISKELNDEVDVRGMDISNDAVLLAEENNLKNETNVEFVKGNVFVNCDTKFDLIVSNPPYIPISDYDSSDIEKSVKLYEPKLALVGDLPFYKALIENYVLMTGSDGFVFELGYEKQFEFTKGLLSEEEWECWLYYDGAGKPRCVVGYKKGSKMGILEGLNK